MRLFGPLALAALAVLPAPGRASETLDFEPCHLQDLSTWALCGSLEVPEDHLQPSGPSLRLRVAVLPAVEQPAQPDPIFLLAGGPGQSAIGLAASVEGALGPANRTRDVVLVDQRGAGGSSPLVCDSLDFLALAFDPGAKRRAVSECLEGLEVDPTLFGTVDFIRDLELVRQALGAERVHLYGGSYGTRAAQVYLREFPQSVASATLDAVASMEMRVGLHMGRDAEPALRDLFRRCAARPRCAERFPDLEARFEALLEDLERSPRDLELPETRSGRPETLRMDHRVFALGIRGLLYSPATLRLVPLLIDQAERGEWAGFHGVSALLAGSIAETMNQTLLLAVLCTEDLAGLREGDIPRAERKSFLGTAQAQEFLDFCAAWPAPKRERLADFTPVKTAVPVLLLSGALDPVTPPSSAEQAAAGFARSRHLVVESGGHIVGGLGCLPERIASFIETRDPESLDASCLEGISLPAFFTSEMGP